MIADSMGSVSHLHPALERPVAISMHNASWLISSKSSIQSLSFGCDLISSPKKRAGALVSCVKSSEVAVLDKSNGECSCDD